MKRRQRRRPRGGAAVGSRDLRHEAPSDGNERHRLMRVRFARPARGGEVARLRRCVGDGGRRQPFRQTRLGARANRTRPFTDFRNQSVQHDNFLILFVFSTIQSSSILKLAQIMCAQSRQIFVGHWAGIPPTPNPQLDWARSFSFRTRNALDCARDKTNNAE